MNTKELQEYHDRFDVIRSMDSFVSEAVDDKLMDPDDCWQPNDFLPDMEREDALDEIKNYVKEQLTFPIL